MSTPNPDQPVEVIDSPTLDIWNRPNPRAIINLVTPVTQVSFILAQEKRPDLFGLDEQALWKKLRSDNCQPTATDHRLRMQFWFEYELAQSEGRRMRSAAFYSGICSKDLWEDKITQCAEKLAWILCPPINYVNRMEEALSFGLMKMRNYLDLDPEDFPPKERIRLMEFQAKLFNMIDMRAKGAYTQKIENKNMNLNIETTDKQVAAALVGESMEALTRKMKELERRERKALNLMEEKKEAIEVKSE